MTNPDVKQAEFQRPTRPVEIIASGVLTAAGANAKMTAASVLGGINAYQASAILNKQFNPMTLALVPDDALPPLEEELLNKKLSSRQQRMLRLATPALLQATECVQQALPLLLCGPEKMPGRRSVVSDNFLQQLVLQTQAPIDLDNSYVFPDGRAGGLYALETAMHMLEQGTFKQIILGGVDSYLDLSLLASLDHDDRVLAEGVVDGFAPAEGAAFMVLQLAGNQPGIKIYPPGVADEPGHRYSQQPYMGDGLANAVSEALSAAGGEPVKTVFSSFNGENFNAKEWGVAALRNQQHLDPDFDIQHPADCYGDLGAATAPVLMVLAHLGLGKGAYKRPAMICVSSEIQQRAAVYMG